MSHSENGSVTNNNSNTPTNSNNRLCHIIKRPDFDGYGFNLHSEKGKPGQYIGKVDEKSPAEQAGLRQGDRIIEVNGVNIGNDTHKQVVQRIKAIANEVRLLVIDPELDKQSKNNKNQVKIENNQTTASIPVSPATSTKSQTNSAKSDKIDASATTVTVKSSSNGHTIDDKNTTMLSSPKSTTTTTENMSNKKDNDESQSNGNANSSASTTSLNSNQDQQQQQQQQKSTGSSGGLNLPMTAAEMRAKLMAKKKYDPKNVTVDLRKKFDIIQEL